MSVAPVTTTSEKVNAILANDAQGQQNQIDGFKLGLGIGLLTTALAIGVAAVIGATQK